MFDWFVKQNWLKVIYYVFQDYLWTQFFPSYMFANDIYDLHRVDNIYSTISNSSNITNLYIHIPFCKTRCKYCHCFSLLNSNDEYEKYIVYLLKEIDLLIKRIWKWKKIDSIFIWWWTPNILWSKLLQKLLHKIKQSFDLTQIKQYNIDLNPYFLNNDIIKLLSDYWINRCTYAVQSFNKEVLEKNARYYKKNINHKNNIIKLKQNWISVNIDLMVGIDYQTLETCILDIKYSQELKVDNISLNYFIQSYNTNYNLTLKNIKLIGEVKKYFNDFIYKKYNKNSNFQEDNYLGRDVNLIWIWNWAITHIFWKMICYNLWNLENYYEDIDNKSFINKKIKFLSKKDEMIKFIWLNLIYGIDKNKFFILFWEDIWKIFKEELNYLESKKIIKINEEFIKPIVSNLKLYIYISIFLRDYIDCLSLKWDLLFYRKNIIKFFLQNWEKIDEDY